jgi:DNA-binding NtrC family response regulator
VKPVAQSESKTLETVLLVEHDPIVLDRVRSILEGAGFCVISAASGAQARHVESITQGAIHLLLSDVMTPDMSGRVISKLIKEHRPNLRVILMACYAGGEMLFLNYGWHFIEKPFVAASLIERVKEVLHTPDRSQGDDGFDTRIKLTESQTQWLEARQPLDSARRGFRLDDIRYEPLLRCRAN